VIYKVGIAILKMFQEEILKFDIEQMSNFMRDGSRRAKVEVGDLLMEARKIVITDKELAGLEQGFHLEQSRIKLHAAEASHTFSEQELEALRWAKTELEQLDLPIKNDVHHFRTKIEKVDRELDSYHKHLLAAYMELV
jgi:hypothetical protein